MRFLLYPAFTDPQALADHFYRLHWYLAPLREQIREIVVPYSGGALDMAPAPDTLDPTLAEIAARAPIGVRFRRIGGEAELAALVAEADRVLLWRSETPGMVPEALRDRRVVRVDHEREQYASSFYLRVVDSFPELQKAALARSEQVFARIRERCAGEIGYIFGTGPGLAAARERDFSDGVAIACNSMVANLDLLDQLRPPLIVVGDPIFHAGPSRYAAAFRKALVVALDRYNSDLVVPMRDHHIYEEHLPERFRERICAIPFRKDAEPHLALDRSLHVSVTANILTLFLLPLAATLFEETRILGCDGRPLDQDKYFWGHDPASQFNAEMAGIRAAHPAFFALDYNDYYLTHCETLERWLEAGEAGGKRFVNLTPSYIPALIERSAPGVAALGEARMPPRVSIIMPAFNAALFIEDAVQSVLTQDFTDLELIVVDDGSTDATREIVARFADVDPRVKLLRNPRKGVSSARNTGIEAAQGRYIGFLDADDTYDPGSLRARVAVLDSEGGPSLVHARVRRVDENGRDLGQTVGEPRALTFADMWRSAVHINTLLGRAALIKASPFDERYANGEDWLFVARLLRKGFTSAYVAAGGGTWRLQPGSTTAGAMVSHIDALRPVVEEIYGKWEGAAEGFREGLKEPPKQEVLQLLSRNALLWQLFAGDAQSAKAILNNSETSAWLADRNLKYWLFATDSVGTRFFRRHRYELRRLPEDVREGIRNTALASDLVKEAPTLARALAGVFDIDLPGISEERQGLPEQADRVALVIGSGPSTRRLIERGLHNLPAGVDTFCVDAAYRYLRLAGWWPTYYASCSPEVTYSHRKHLARMVKDLSLPTKRFFFSLPIVDDRKVRLVSAGSSVAFCVRQAIKLGYRKVFFIGCEDEPVASNSRMLTGSERVALEKVLPAGTRWADVRVVTANAADADRVFYPLLRMKGDLFASVNASQRKRDWKDLRAEAVTRGAEILSLETAHEYFPMIALDSAFDWSRAADAERATQSRDVLIAFPTLRTAAELEFWSATCRAIATRGYRPRMLTYFSLDARRPAGLSGVENYTCIFEPLDRSGYAALAGKPELSNASAVQSGLGACNAYARTTLRAYDEASARAAYAGSADLCGALGRFLDTLCPAQVMLNNDTFYVPVMTETLLKQRGIPYFFTERSPLVTNWVEPHGFYAEAEAWKQPPAFADEAGYDEIGARVMASLAVNPAMHRAQSSELRYAPQAGASLGEGHELTFLIAMDAVLNTGWTPPGHPKRALNYPMFETPEEAVRAIKEVADALGAKLVVKPHPNDAHFNAYKDFEGVEIYKGSIEEALAGADVVFCFLTKVAFAAIAQRKKVVTLAQNIAALSGVTFHCTSADQIEAKTREALTSEWDEAKETRARRFFGWLERDYFVANDLSNPGAQRFLDRYFPPLPEAARAEVAPDLDARLRAIPGVLPRLQSADPEGAGEHAPSMLYGPFARADDFRVDEVDIVLNMFAAGLLKPEHERGMMIDVGACKGGAFAGFARMGWEVHAFEPNPPMHAYITEKAMLPGVTLNQLAVSEKSGEDLPFYTSEESIGISSLSPFRDSHKPTAIVKTIRLDEYTAKAGISHADFLKVDTEGFDIFVLKSHDWENIRPQVVVCEFEDFKTDKLGYSVEQLAAFLEERGYSIYASEWHPITRYGGGEHRWRAMHKWREGCLPKTSWGNLIAFRDPIDDATVARFTWQTIEAARAKRLRKAALDKHRAEIAALDAAVAANPPRAPAGPKKAKPAKLRPPVWSPPPLTLLAEPALSAAGPVLLAAQTNVARPSDLIVCSEKLEGWKPYECAAISGEAWFPLGGLENLQPAMRVIESGADSVHGLRRTIKAKRAGAIEFSGFVRAAGRSAIAVWAGEANCGVNFDLAAARLSHTLPQGRFRIVEAEMLRSAGEWGQWRQFRVVVWAEAPGPMLLQVNLLEEAHAGSRYRGDGASGVDLWGLHAFYPQMQRQPVRDAV